MQSIYKKISQQLGLSLFAMFVVVALAAPQQAAAATSGNATIYNSVKVDYTSGANTYIATATNTVTVNTLGAPATVVMTPAIATIATNDPYTLTVKITSNANGVTDYYSANSSVDNLVGAPTGLTGNGTISLWGGIVTASAAGQISIPNGSETGLIAGDTINIGGVEYTVGPITPGAPATTDAAGVVTGETNTTVVIYNLGTAVPATVVAAVGSQVGEVGTYTVAITNAGTPLTIGVDGTHTITTSVTTAATDGAGAAIAPVTASSVLTVTSAALTISKTADVTNAKPGDTITYTITVSNPSTTAAASSVSITDAVPVYTTYVANSTLLNGITVAGDGAASPLAGGFAVDDNSPVRAAGAVATGNIAPLGTATITYQVTVD